MKHLIPELGDTLKHIKTGYNYTVIGIAWRKHLNDYEVAMKDNCTSLYEPMHRLAKTKWKIVTPESMNFM
jgi:hypothetical protein